ncbi:helix-turn-helix domain-containing protein [Bradyrhizobium sp. SK17]|nr:helix-turn-helix domain-containing protein [Bradyrhizobium sp. SK17]
MIAQELRITPRAAQDLVGELGLREATGRDRYRAWGCFRCRLTMVICVV